MKERKIRGTEREMGEEREREKIERKRGDTETKRNRLSRDKK